MECVGLAWLGMLRPIGVLTWSHGAGDGRYWEVSASCEQERVRKAWAVQDVALEVQGGGAEVVGMDMGVESDVHDGGVSRIRSGVMRSSPISRWGETGDVQCSMAMGGWPAPYE